MPASLATVGAILKEIYEPKVRKMLNDDVVTLKRIERSCEGVESTVGGRYVTFLIKTRRNAGIGARNEQELLPVPGQQGYAAARVGLRYLYGGIQLTGQTLELADSNAQAFTSALDGEIEGLNTDLAKDLNRQVYGNGTGAVAVVTATGANQMTVKSTQYLQLGMQVDVVDGTTLNNASPTIKISNRQVTAIDTVAKTFTYDGASVAVAANDIVVRTGNVNREWTGFAKTVSATGTLYNVDPTVEGTWKAEVDSNAGTNRPLSEGLMISMIDRIATNGGKTTVIFANLGVRRAYFNLLSQQRQYVNTKEFDGGFSGLGFVTDRGEVPIVTDVDAPANSMYFLNEKEFTLYCEKDWSWMDRDGSKFRNIQGYDAYEARMFQYSELACHRRNSQGLISDLTEG